MENAAFKRSILYELKAYIQKIELKIYQTELEIQDFEKNYDVNAAAQCRYYRLSSLEEHLEVLTKELDRMEKQLEEKEKAF